MANILSSKLVTLPFPALALILSLCVSNCNCWSLNTYCTGDSNCFGPSNHCWLGKCCRCGLTETFSGGSCFTILSNELTKTCPSFLTEGIAIILLLVVIGGGVAACCFCISGCPGHKWRKRNEPPAQPNVYPNPAQYPSQSQFVAPHPNGANVSVQGGNGPPQYPVQQQQQYAYPNMNQNYDQYPNQYPAPPPPPYYNQYPNQYAGQTPNYSHSQYPNPNVPVQANARAQAEVPVSSPTTNPESKNGPKDPSS